MPTTCWLGLSDFRTCSPTACSVTLGHEVLDDRVADVGFEQGLLHQGQPFAHVRFGELALAAQGLERAGQTFLQGFEHDLSQLDEASQSVPTTVGSPTKTLLTHCLAVDNVDRQIPRRKLWRGGNSAIVTKAERNWQSVWQQCFAAKTGGYWR